jgi:hypothetical protein
MFQAPPLASYWLQATLRPSLGGRTESTGRLFLGPRHFLPVLKQATSHADMYVIMINKSKHRMAGTL